MTKTKEKGAIYYEENIIKNHETILDCNDFTSDFYRIKYLFFNVSS